MATHASQLSVRLPRGEAASFEEMQVYGSILQTFICEQEDKLDEIADTERRKLFCHHHLALVLEAGKRMSSC